MDDTPFSLTVRSKISNLNKNYVHARLLDCSMSPTAGFCIDPLTSFNLIFFEIVLFSESVGKFLIINKVVVTMKILTHLIGIIVTTMFIGFPSSVNAMSARPPIIFEPIESGLYLQKDLRQSDIMLVHDKNGNVIGWARESYLDSNKTILYDMNNNVKGYLKIDLINTRKLRFFNK